MKHTFRLTSLLPAALALLPFLAAACGGSGSRSFTQKERRKADSAVSSTATLGGLDNLCKQAKKKGDALGAMTALREKGRRLRDESLFSAALQVHGEGLELAERTGDTIEWVKALNNIGTDYRRMGILDMAQRYHYAAWIMASESADTSYEAKKNRVVSLNGLANVYMTINNTQRADSVLRLALAGETELGSLTGQAINYANLGSIYDQRGQEDSAWTYYRKSMELNRRDGNTLGIALCHTYYGDLYRKERKYDAALAEYKKAYELMKGSKDSWHELNSLIAIARTWVLKGDNQRARSYLDEALATAKAIHSTEHLAEIYRIYYKMYRRQGDYHRALDYYELAGALEDSLVDMDKLNLMQNTTLTLERNQQERRMAEANSRLVQEKSSKRTAYVVFIIVVLSMGGFIGALFHARKVRAKSHRALERLNKTRERFFVNITHEFRTPLTVILGLSDDLQKDGTTTAEAHEIGKTISRQGRRMLRLINQLLDISKIRSEIGTPDWRSGNIAAYVGMIVETYADYARKLGITLQFIPREKDIETDFVPDYVSKVMGNLLSNSLKFTDKYGTVNVSMWRDEKSLMIDVADNGRGIPTESLPYIFEEFYQADNTDDGVGTGVGLALVSQIVRSLGGSVGADSVLGKGTTFHVVLPLRHGGQTPALSGGEGAAEAAASVAANGDSLIEKPAGEVQVSAAAATAEGEDARRRILVIEDNADIASFIGTRLDDKYAVDFAQNGKDGLAKAREWMPDAVITDLMMPVMDGLEVCREIRKDEVTSHIPVIILTAKVTDRERIEGIGAGADAYLTKPFNSDELRVRVEKLLEQRDMLRRKFARAVIDEGLVKPSEGQSAGAEVRGAGAKLLPTDADRRFLARATDCVYMMLNERRTVDVNAVASKLCMTYGQFNRKLTALTALTPAQYIQRIKIGKAKRMLVAHPELSFNAVADQCGFADYSTFVRAFRNVCGITPTQFVRQ